eukprot:TRINITY_DN28289_c0_g1_i1.p2 TRINITY_DN28289_c0_g1~~TRINITY_DN28289_c0_g1_i1.p2  ORF type:complete len:158 (+),score=36.74 TRINITY_DN28289_c0_g1_i1:427-900(+)
METASHLCSLVATDCGRNPKAQGEGYCAHGSSPGVVVRLAEQLEQWGFCQQPVEVPWEHPCHSMSPELKVALVQYGSHPANGDAQVDESPHGDGVHDEPDHPGDGDPGVQQQPVEAHQLRVVWNLSLIHISEPTRLLSISYAVFCLKKKKKTNNDSQ